MNSTFRCALWGWMRLGLCASCVVVGTIGAPAQQPAPPVRRPTPQVRPAVPVPARPTPNVPGAVQPQAQTAGAAAEEPATGEPSMTPEEAAQLGDDDLVTLNLPNAPLETALDLYASLVRRVLLRPPQLAGGPINLRFEDLTREESIEAMNAVFALNGISVLPVGEKFIKVVPSQEVVQHAGQLSDLGTEEFSELGQFTTKLIKVTKIKPGDIAQAVQQFASGKVQNPVLVFDDQNFFILRDQAANVKRMAELIKELDVEIELDYTLEVIPIRYGRVEEIYDTLNSVVTGQASTGSSRSSTRASNFRSGSGSSSSSSRSGFGNTLGSGYPSTYSPQQVTPGRTTTGMASPGAARTSFAQRLSQVSAAAAGGGSQYNLLGDARIIPDVRSNSLIVYAGKEDFKMLTNIVAKIDTLLAQVLIESIILEVNLNKGQEFGVSMVQNPRQFGDWSTAGASINNASLATNFLNAIFPSGFSYFGQYKDQFAFALKAVADDGRAKLLARPRIQTTHAQMARFEIGRSVPYPRTQSPYYSGGIGGSTPFTTYEEKDVLTSLEVTPYITPDGLVTLEVSQTINQLGADRTIGTDVVPEILKRQAEAVLSVRDREPVILGGFINSEDRNASGGVPWLKDIPLLGWAFRSKTSSSSRSELIVLIRPTILNTPQEASDLAELEQRSLPNAAAALRDFQAQEARMAEQLGVAPGVTNAPPDEGRSSKSKRRKKSE